MQTTRFLCCASSLISSFYSFSFHNVVTHRLTMSIPCSKFTTLQRTCIISSEMHSEIFLSNCKNHHYSTTYTLNSSWPIGEELLHDSLIGQSGNVANIFVIYSNFSQNSSHDFARSGFGKSRRMLDDVGLSKWT